MKKLDDIISSDPPSKEDSSSQTELTNLISELTKIKDEGNDLYKEKN